METKTKRNFIIWGVVFLVILNISSLGTIWYHRYQFTHNGMQRNSLENYPRKRSQRAPSDDHRGPSILTKGLDLSDKQNQRFDSVWQHYSKFRRGLETKMESNRKEMGLIMLKEEIDTSAFYAISSSQSQLMLKLDHSMINMILDLKSILNKQQMETFLKRIEMLKKRRNPSFQHEPQVKKRAK